MLAGLLFMGYRCTQQRFSELDDDDGRGIRWPELLKPSEEETTTLNPLSTKRREGAAGFDMDETKSIASHEGVTAPMEGQRRGMREQYGVDGAWNSADHQEHLVAAGLGIPGPVMMSRTPSSAGSSTDHFSGGNGQYYASPHQQQAYCGFYTHRECAWLISSRRRPVPRRVRRAISPATICVSANAPADGWDTILRVLSVRNASVSATTDRSASQSVRLAADEPARINANWNEYRTFTIRAA